MNIVWVGLQKIIHAYMVDIVWVGLQQIIHAYVVDRAWVGCDEHSVGGMPSGDTFMCG